MTYRDYVIDRRTEPIIKAVDAARESCSSAGVIRMSADRVQTAEMDEATVKAALRQLGLSPGQIETLLEMSPEQLAELLPEDGEIQMGARLSHNGSCLGPGLIMERAAERGIRLSPGFHSL